MAVFCRGLDMLTNVHFTLDVVVVDLANESEGDWQLMKIRTLLVNGGP